MFQASSQKIYILYKKGKYEKVSILNIIIRFK